MRMIPTTVHGAIDYVMGVVLIVAPWIFGFSDTEAAKWISVILGIGVIAYSLLTDYEFGMIPMIPMTTHLWIDAASGVFLAISPWLFGFAEEAWIFFVIVGLGEIAAAAMTQRHPGRRRVTHKGVAT